MVCFIADEEKVLVFSGCHCKCNAKYILLTSPFSQKKIIVIVPVCICHLLKILPIAIVFFDTLPDDRQCFFSCYLACPRLTMDQVIY